MWNKIYFLIIFCLLMGCSLKNIANPQLHPADMFFNSLEYPRIGINQINSKRISQDPTVINNLAMFDLVIINKSNDLFVDRDSNYEYAEQIKAINPNTKVLQYLSISDIWQGQDTFKNWIPLHPEALLKDNSGNYVHPYASQYGTKRYMTDPTQPVWQNYFATRMKKIVDQGMDGVFIDNPWRTNYQNLNISPERFEQIQQGWEQIMQLGRSLIGANKLIIANSPPYQLYQTRDMTMTEGRLEPNKQSLDNYFKISEQAKSYGQLNFDTVKARTYTGSNFHYIPEFFLPAVLLTDNIWGVSLESPQIITLINQVGKIGYPTGPRYRNNGVLQRDYTKGKVILNDTNTAQTVTLPANSYRNINNVQVNQITLAPMKGIVLKKI